MSSLLYGVSFTDWEAQSGLSNVALGDHAMKTLQDLTGETGSLDDLMFTYLSVQGFSGALSDKVFAWDGSFAAKLLLESGDFLLLQSGDRLLLQG